MHVETVEERRTTTRHTAGLEFLVSASTKGLFRLSRAYLYQPEHLAGPFRRRGSSSWDGTPDQGYPPRLGRLDMFPEVVDGIFSGAPATFGGETARRNRSAESLFRDQDLWKSVTSGKGGGLGSEVS